MHAMYTTKPILPKKFGSLNFNQTMYPGPVGHRFI